MLSCVNLKTNLINKKMNKETLAEVIALLNTANYDTETLNHKRDEVVNTLKKQLSMHNVSQTKRDVCPDCGDRGWLYDDEGRRRGTCPCHY